MQDYDNYIAIALEIPQSCFESSIYRHNTALEAAHHRFLLDIDGLMQKRRNPSALAMELRLFCIKPSDSS